MIKEFKIPSPGESISEVELAEWFVKDGAYVEKNDELAEIESEKATLQLVAEESGEISIKVKAGETAKVGTVAYTIDTSASSVTGASTSSATDSSTSSATDSSTGSGSRESDKSEGKDSEGSKSEKDEKSDTEDTDRKPGKETTDKPHPEENKAKITPVAAEIMKENNLNVDDIINGLRRITKNEVNAVLESKNEQPTTTLDNSEVSRDEERNKMSMLRRKVSERLVKVKNETAMLTTFNEVDMSTVIELRKTMQSSFVDKYGFKLGFMGFFAKAVSIAARLYPAVNSQIDGDEIVTPNYVDVGIAVQTPKGLMVPNIRNAESKSIAQIEKEIKELAEKARNKKISVEELSGGTFSITNGGVFGSLLSTPIINPPQSAILGMHNIIDRPVAVNKQVVIRPMMYIALSYDHRIIDGKDSVGFLKTVKELIENPEKMLTNGNDPAKVLLGL
ncbi:MAG: 2-oxoglutarate dehydrogenase complex dihydrolipoyllysine-residue succinyltransferase [Prolixibacteraceae bacterium]|jgi:2-oxoglutarate dehydrogenase E2 component (dihydrolipoamide succinyltransferase)|nr:2-oxoglutarate dehydrogenase complex dihydrolipoyllysine-residue succinyltransferase [Prolixibacteraceae bacterium]